MALSEEGLRECAGIRLRIGFKALRDSRADAVSLPPIG